MSMNELKTELSKLSGVDFHNPKYRAVFKKYFPAEADEKRQEDAEESKVETVAEKDSENPETAAEKTAPETVEDETADAAEPNAATSTEGQVEQSDKDDTEAESAEVDVSAEEAGDVEPETEQAEDLSAEDKALKKYIPDNDDDSESDVAGKTDGEPEIKTEAEAATEPVDLNDQLLATKLELELVRAGIREDRLDTAKRLFMPEFKANGDVEQLRTLISQYPEWIGNKGGAQGFGMPLGGKADALTNEEKALKRMGIDPRD